MNDLWRIILSTIGGIGGIGAVIVVIVKLCSNIIANNLKKKYELELNERFEKYKANVESKKYITKVRFDAEFKIYRELSKAFSEMVKNVNLLIPLGASYEPSDKKEKERNEKELFLKTQKSYENALDVLFSNASFISEELYNKHSDIAELVSKQLYEYRKRWNISFPGTREEKSILKDEVYNRIIEINMKTEELNSEIRNHLDSLEVM